MDLTAPGGNFRARKLPPGAVRSIPHLQARCSYAILDSKQPLIVSSSHFPLQPMRHFLSSSFHTQLPTVTYFARRVLDRPLYPYQSEVAEAIVASVLGGHGSIFTVMMSRQSGKNQLSAVLEAYLLACMAEGTIVKAAPTFNPQILNSRLRLLTLLDTPPTRERIWSSNGYIIGLAPRSDAALLR